MKRDEFDESMDKELLKNGFSYYDDWEYGPMSGWSTDCEYYALRLMRHDFGYWLIVSPHASGTNPTSILPAIFSPKTNLGSSNSAKEIIAIRDALKKLMRRASDGQ